MNAVMIETPKTAARRLATGAIRDGFEPLALHEYQAADGTPVYWRIRLKHPDTGDKWIRPMRWNSTGYEIGEPVFPNGKPLYRWPELLADPSVPVWIVEGESCADALAKLGLIATTSGSATSADGADWTPLRGRTVIVWPDNDESGSKYAETVTAHLKPLNCDVRMIDKALIRALPDGGDCADWITANPNATADSIRALPTVAAVKAEAGSRSAPEPLRRPTPAPAPYPAAKLGPIIGPACESLRRVIQAPDAVCGASLLAAASLAAQGLADVRNDGRKHPLSLWMLTVAESGERKSAVDAEAMRGVREVEHELHKAYTDELARHQTELEEWNAKREAAKVAARKRQGEGLADVLSRLGPAPEAPLLPKLTAADFTAEGLAKLLLNGRPSVGVFTDEAALVFGGHGMTKETVTRTAGTLSKLWDSGTLDRIRAGDGAIKLYGRRLALHLMAQPIIAERALSDDVLAGQGFLARCLLAWPESTAGTREYRAESLRDDPALMQFTARIRDLLQRPLPLADGTRNELNLRALTLTVDAKAAWVAVHNAIEHALTSTGRYAVCKPWASKGAEQCLRIAGVLTLVEEPDAQQIEAATIERAAELVVWHLGEAARLAGTSELSPEVRDAEALLNWCHETGRTSLHSSAALRLGPRRIRERERFMQAVGELERAGWAEQIEGGMFVDGRHRQNVWRIAPKED